MFDKELATKIDKTDQLNKVDQKIINLADTLKTVEDVKKIIYNYNTFNQACILKVLLWKNIINKFEKSDFFFKWCQEHECYLI